MDSPENYDRLVGKYFPGCTLVNSWRLAGGISTQMTCLEITCSGDGDQAAQTRKVILRWPNAAAVGLNPGTAEVEFRILQTLYLHGLPVPEPIGLVTSAEFSGGVCLILGYLEGSVDFAPTHLAKQSREMADYMTRIHSLVRTAGQLSFLPRVGEGLSLTPQPAVADSALGDETLWNAVLSGWPCPSSNPVALLHGDFWPGNILWQDGKISGVIDWEDAVIGDPLADLAISRLDLLWIYGPEAMEAFTTQYLTLAGINPDRLAYWDLVAAQRLARLVGTDLDGWAAFFEPYGRTDISGRSIRTYFTSFVSQAYTKLGYL